MTESEDEPDVADPATFHDRLDEAAPALDAAETEAELDAVEVTLDEITEDLEAATLPEPEPPEDEEDEDAEEPPDPREELDDRLDDLRDSLEEQRGPYADEVVDEIQSAKTTLETTEWAEEGKAELVEVVDEFLGAVEQEVDADFDRPPEADVDAMATRYDDAAEAVEAAGLHPDDDTPTIESLLDIAAELSDGIDDATAFEDLEVREQLHRRGFFDDLGHYTDFPPEWSAIKAHEEAGNVDMILLAYDKLDSNFIEEHCLDALRRIGDERALDPMMNLARRRDRDAIAVLGRIGSEEPVDMLLDYVSTDSDPLLQQTSMKALGEIGSTEATEEIAQQLVSDSVEVRSMAARSLGMIGDPRAIDPLVQVLEADDIPHVRGSAAWALVEIGTERALEAVAEYADDPSFLVEAEAEKAQVAASTA